MQNHAKGATAWFTDLAHILHVGMTWGSIHNKIPSKEGGTARNLIFLVFLKLNIDR